MYRVHDEPSLEKLEALRATLATVGIKLAKGQVMMPKHFMRILEQAESLPSREMVHQMVLRTQAQAQYDPANIGHFGLALRRYAHFTSPIRRYADLLIHRALIAAFGMGDGGLPPDAVAGFSDVAEHISMTERRAAKAEREVVDRYAALYLADRVGASFPGRIGGVSRFGLFVTLHETGADGLVPISTLPDDFYRHDEARNRLVGQRNGRVFALGDAVTVVLAEADPLTGSLILTLDEGDAAPPRRPAPRLVPHKPKHRR
jgi:ribonuclease R